MSTLKVGADASIELALTPGQNLVSTVRRFVAELCADLLGDARMTTRIALATHELLDNGARHSLDGRASIRVGLRREETAVVVQIQTTNHASPANIARLASALDDIAESPNVSGHYLILLRRAAERSRNAGLGLGRVRAEADMRLSHGVEGDLVILRADARFDMGGAP